MSSVEPSSLLQRRQDQEGHPWSKLPDKVNGEDQIWWKITRDMPVPAPCWRAPWVDGSKDVVPYYRDRFVLDWSDAKVPDGKTFFISGPSVA